MATYIHGHGLHDLHREEKCDPFEISSSGTPGSSPSSSPSSSFTFLEGPLLVNILAFVCGSETLEHWRGQTKDCLLCPMAEGEAIPMITADAAATRYVCL